MLLNIIIYNNMNSNILSFDIDTPIIKSIHKQTKRRQMKGKLLCLVCPYIIIIILLVLLYSLLSKMKQLDNQYNKLNKNVLEHIFSPYRTDIIESIEELSLLKHWIGTTVSDNKIITMKMVYKATKDGDEAGSFHQKTQEGTNYLILIICANNIINFQLYIVLVLHLYIILYFFVFYILMHSKYKAYFE